MRSKSTGIPGFIFDRMAVYVYDRWGSIRIEGSDGEKSVRPPGGGGGGGGVCA